MVYNPQKSYSDGSATEIHFGPQFYSWFMLNDITSASEYFYFILYADDTTLFGTMPYSLPALPNEHNALINGELFKVNDSHVSILSSLNAYKTKNMIFRSSKKTKLTFPKPNFLKLLNFLQVRITNTV